MYQSMTGISRRPPAHSSMSAFFNVSLPACNGMCVFAWQFNVSAGLSLKKENVFCFFFSLELNECNNLCN